MITFYIAFGLSFFISTTLETLVNCKREKIPFLIIAFLFSVFLWPVILYAMILSIRDGNE